MRILLYVLTNFAVMIVFGIVISIVLAILGIPSGSIGGLMVIALVFGFGGSFISLLLSKTMAKRAVGAEVIDRPSNETERWLVNTVKVLSDKAGIKMPEVAIYPALDINAFATGARRDASLVAVSTGLLNSMTKQEAEAVIAHEISHVANGDMVTMTLLQGIMNTFVIFLSRLIAQVAAGFLNNNREDDSGSSGSYAIYFLVSFVLEIVFGIAASVITMWFSRYREFKADAGSASLVGKEKMIAALQKLKTSYEPEEKASIMAFCINGKPSAFAALFLSHPPLDRRIEALRNSEYLK